MKNLKDILYKVAIERVVGDTSVAINAIQFNSINVKSNDVFVAIKGSLVDGHKYIDAAIKNNAVAVICEVLPHNLKDEITYVVVNRSSEALAYMSANYYQNPSQNIRLIGVTGTNGKTTIATLLYQLFKKAGYKVGLLSTVKVMVDEQEYPATHTTPDSISINSYLNEMCQEGVEFCFMEVSSHGIHQDRTLGLHFEGGIFTNLVYHLIKKADYKVVVLSTVKVMVDEQEFSATHTTLD